MSVGLYMDEHVPQGITHGLRDRGVDVLTIQEDEHDGLDDSIQLDRATDLRRVVFTQDHDFFSEAAERQRAGVEFSGVFFMQQYRLSYRECIEELELIAKCSQWDEWIGQINSIPLGR